MTVHVVLQHSRGLSALRDSRLLFKTFNPRGLKPEPIFEALKVDGGRPGKNTSRYYYFAAGSHSGLARNRWSWTPFQFSSLRSPIITQDSANFALTSAGNHTLRFWDGEQESLRLECPHGFASMDNSYKHDSYPSTKHFQIR